MTLDELLALPVGTRVRQTLPNAWLPDGEITASDGSDTTIRWDYPIADEIVFESIDEYEEFLANWKVIDELPADEPVICYSIGPS